ncbi:hypothetical protein LUZ60_012930 [Juncus effusus]|nr:hypothetical protein LUZ60_012930 [Juncus effusus]
MKPIERMKPYLSLSSDNSGGATDMKRGCITASVCTLLVASCALVTYSAFLSSSSSSSDQFTPWPCPSCSLSTSSPPVTSAAQGPSSQSQTETNLSHIVFGIGGSAQTWDQRRAYTELWWQPNRTRGYVWLDEQPIGVWPDTCPPYKISSDASRYGNRASASRIAQIAVETFRLAESSPNRTETRWFVMGDDDTVFFVENLVTALGKYDHQQMYYVGMPSESVEQDVMHSYGTAFGGGGFAISYPAAEAMAGVMEGCLDRYAGFYGSDQRVQSCLTELGIPLTREPGFHQVDLRGDLYGYLSAHPIAPLISLHHLDYVNPIVPNKPSRLDSLKTLISAYRFDPARTLQQTFCYQHGSDFTWSISVSWGYTVQIYPWILSASELEMPLQTFSTWRSFGRGPFIFNTRRFDNSDVCSLPLVFFLDRVDNQTGRVLNGESTVTEYTKYKITKENAKCNKRGFSAASKISRVRVFSPKMDPSLWKMAPRRQCCVTRRTGIFGRTLEVRIKYCSNGESITPP